MGVYTLEHQGNEDKSRVILASLLVTGHGSRFFLIFRFDFEEETPKRKNDKEKKTSGRKIREFN